MRCHTETARKLNSQNALKAGNKTGSRTDFSCTATNVPHPDNLKDMSSVLTESHLHSSDLQTPNSGKWGSGDFSEVQGLAHNSGTCYCYGWGYLMSLIQPKHWCGKPCRSHWDWTASNTHTWTVIQVKRSISTSTLPWALIKLCAMNFAVIEINSIILMDYYFITNTRFITMYFHTQKPHLSLKTPI